MTGPTAFYAYRLPGQDRAHVATGCEVAVTGALSSIRHRNPFIVNEFHGLTYALLPDVEREVDPGAVELPEPPAYGPELEDATPRQVYMEGAGSIIAELRRHPERKVVYSRVLTAPRRFATLGERFAHLCARHRHAYVFCYHTPQTGLWMGASPELLCRHEAGKVSTMALAGTRDASDPAPWDRKNIAEQAFVTRFVARQLSALGIAASTEGPLTLQAGPVKHLCTRFVSNGPVPAATALRLPELLSPTPALCGTPRPYALRMIRTHEPHTRGCYGGYLGPLDASGRYVFWVNLRSMRVSATGVALYVGGGLTALSTPAQEWEETAAKALTLL